MPRHLHRLVQTPGRRVVIDLMAEPRDMWLGLYWRAHVSTARRRCVLIYVCLLPCLPLRISLVLWRTRRSWEQIAEEWED